MTEYYWVPEAWLLSSAGDCLIEQDDSTAIKVVKAEAYDELKALLREARNTLGSVRWIEGEVELRKRINKALGDET